jgi:hypothetical protein
MYTSKIDTPGSNHRNGTTRSSDATLLLAGMINQVGRSPTLALRLRATSSRHWRLFHRLSWSPEFFSFTQPSLPSTPRPAIEQSVFGLSRILAARLDPRSNAPHLSPCRGTPHSCRSTSRPNPRRYSFALISPRGPQQADRQNQPPYKSPSVKGCENDPALSSSPGQDTLFEVGRLRSTCAALGNPFPKGDTAVNPLLRLSPSSVPIGNMSTPTTRHSLRRTPPCPQ